MQKILLVDDDPELAESVRTHLQNAGYEVAWAADGGAALAIIERDRFDLLILDVVLPKMRGFDLCKQIREKLPDIPILFLSGQSDPIDKTLGLELGADDYLTKPFASQELIARIRAILRRYGVSQSRKELPGAGGAILDAGEIRIDFDTISVHRRGELIPLTATEFRFLACLASNAGRTLTRDQLREAVWGSVAAGFDQTVTSTLSRLRSKLEDDPDKPKYIQTVRGFGYRFSASGDDERKDDGEGE